MKPTPEERRERRKLFLLGMSAYVLLPTAAWLTWSIVSSRIGWHGEVSDVLIMLIILAANGFGLWRAKWNVGYPWYAHTGICIGAFALSILLMAFTVVYFRMNHF